MQRIEELLEWLDSHPYSILAIIAVGGMLLLMWLYYRNF